MDKRTREIVALVLLVVLLAVAACAMVWYLLIGHNWNVAATNIDDRVGEMEGYTVLLYDGQTLPETERMRISNAQPMLDDENRGTPRPAYQSVQVETPITLDEVVTDYREKGATVFVLHPEDLELYEGTSVLNKNGVWIGAITVDGKMSGRTVAKYAKTLKERDVDFVVACVSDTRLIENPVDGVDILVSIGDEDIPSGGQYSGATFCSDSPFIGHVQAIIISPSNVISAKVVDSL